MNEIIIEVKKISKVYDEMTDNPVISLNNISMSIEKGEFICVMGTSGSGKTTFINCISTMDTPSKGQVILYGKSTILHTETISINRDSIYIEAKE